MKHSVIIQGLNAPSPPKKSKAQEMLPGLQKSVLRTRVVL